MTGVQTCALPIYRFRDGQEWRGETHPRTHRGEALGVWMRVDAEQCLCHYGHQRERDLLRQERQGRQGSAHRCQQDGRRL